LCIYMTTTVTVEDSPLLEMQHLMDETHGQQYDDLLGPGEVRPEEQPLMHLGDSVVAFDRQQSIINSQATVDDQHMRSISDRLLGSASEQLSQKSTAIDEDETDVGGLMDGCENTERGHLAYPV
jgi:hypothetical protein